MKKPLSPWLTALALLVLVASCTSQTPSETGQEEATVEITTRANDEVNTIKLDLGNLQKGLEELGEELERLGEKLEKTDFEVLEVEEREEGEMKLTVTEKEDGEGKRKKVLYGKEAERYLEERRKDKDSKIVMDIYGGLNMSIDEKKGEEDVHIEINVDDLLRDIGIEVKETNKKDKKVLIITHPEGEKDL